MRLSLDDLREVNALVARLSTLRREASWPTPKLQAAIQAMEHRLAELGIDPGKTDWGKAQGSRPA